MKFPIMKYAGGSTKWGRHTGKVDRFVNVDLFMAGSLTEDEYQSRKTELNLKAEEIARRITELEQKLISSEVMAESSVTEALAKMKIFSGAERMDEKMVHELVNKGAYGDKVDI